MSVVQNYLNGLKQTYDEILGEDEWRDFVACICGASDEDIAKLKAQFPLIPQSLIELLQFVDSTNWRTYQGGDVGFFMFGSIPDDFGYPCYLNSCEQMLNSRDEFTHLKDYINRNVDPTWGVEIDDKIIKDFDRVHWLHLADCMNNGGTSQLFIDFSPSDEGKVGQVVMYLHDPDELTVIADLLLLIRIWQMIFNNTIKISNIFIMVAMFGGMMSLSSYTFANTNTTDEKTLCGMTQMQAYHQLVENTEPQYRDLYKDAIKKTVETAYQGDVEAISELVQFYLYFGQEQQTICWVEKFTENGYPDAWQILAGAYDNGWQEGFKQDTNKAYEYYLKAANAGSESAQLWLSKYYQGMRRFDGGFCNCGDVNADKALMWAKKAYESGSEEASYNIAEIYAKNYQNIPLAIQWYQKVIDEGLATIAKFGEDFTGSEVQSARLYNHFSYISLGDIYFEKKDYAKAMEYYLKDINMPTVSYATRSYYMVGQMYEHGLGVTKDSETAKSYYQKACRVDVKEACQ